MNRINRKFVEFNKIISTDFLLNKKIAVIEDQSIDCTNFIKFLSRELNYEILSPFKTKIESTEKKIIDDFFNGKLIFNCPIENSTIAIFRANSFSTGDIFNFDIHIKIQPLKSGYSDFIKGEIIFTDRKNFTKQMYFLNEKNSIFFSEKLN